MRTKGLAFLFCRRVALGSTSVAQVDVASAYTKGTITTSMTHWLRCDCHATSIDKE